MENYITDLFDTSYLVITPLVVIVIYTLLCIPLLVEWNKSRMIWNSVLKDKTFRAEFIDLFNFRIDWLNRAYTVQTFPEDQEIEMTPENIKQFVNNFLMSFSSLFEKHMLLDVLTSNIEQINQSQTLFCVYPLHTKRIIKILNIYIIYLIIQVISVIIYLSLK